MREARILEWFLIPKKKVFPQKDLVITLRCRKSSGKWWLLTRGQRDTESLSISWLLHYVCRVVPAQDSYCGNKCLTGNRASRNKKKGLHGPGCSVWHHVSWEGGGVFNPSGSGQLPGSSSFPSMATLQPLSHQSMTSFAGQALAACSLSSWGLCSKQLQAQECQVLCTPYFGRSRKLL